VLGSTDSGPDGAFAIVLDDPLKPGDYTITLRQTVGGTTVASAQTAVVSVPQSPTGQVLAMVEEPGKASQLITVPQAATKAAASDQAAAAAQAPATTAPATTAPAASDTASGATAPAATDQATAPAAAAAAEPKIAVEAVEIDGSKIFVAGTADPGRKVRAYADAILLGDAQTSADGHFLIEATRDIPVGNYTIHVDGLDDDGVKVVARAAVPFEREPGESIAAVAPNETKTGEAKPAETELAQVQGAGSSLATEAKPAEAPATAETKPVATVEAAKPAEAPAKVAEATPSADVPETVAPKLEHTDGAVIIRRNDTLWRISRRVYGHGVRYSTIYLANKDQIRDPDRIWPGQVFKVPSKSKEGEDADMKAMGEQMTAAPAKTE
jgi:nucleoid-associated protein YgaU